MTEQPSVAPQIPGCPHAAFNIWCDVKRLTDGEGGPVIGYHAHLRLACSGCGEPFVFLGLPTEGNIREPIVTPLGETARLPIGPVSVENPAALAKVSMVIQ